MRRIISLFLLLMLLFATTEVFATDTIKIYFLNKQITADVSAYIENSRTMVPVRMITEKMGYDVLWNATTRVVTVYSSGKKVLLTIDNKTAVVDGKNVQMDTPALIRQDRTFVPIRFISENFGYDVDWDNDTRSVLITKPKEEETVENIEITKIFTERTANKLYLKIQAENGRIEQPKSMWLDNPKRYVLDIDNALLKADSNEIKVGSEYISRIRVSQFTVEPYSVRLVVDLNKETEITYGYDSGFFTITITDLPSSIKSITANKASDKDVLKISSNTVLAPECFVLYNPYRIVFDFYNTACTASEVTFTGNYIEKVQFYEHPDKTRVTLTAKENAGYQYQADGTLFQITITGPSKPVPTPSASAGTAVTKKEKLIVLDPGHGGTEPGTLGKIDGEVVIQEKEINLSISNKVLKILKEKGYNVIATRTTDTYVGLTTRADIANSANADLFVSIHNNSFEDASAHGTLTMYAYDDAKESFNISGKTIANIMQKELAKGTGGYDRGLLKNPQIVVLRKTNMPAILLECLFMSNENDMKELLKESRLDKIAESVALGIENIYSKMLEADKTAVTKSTASPSPSPKASASAQPSATP